MIVSHEIAAAARVLSEGGLVAFPTETVYGLGADATAPHAVARIFAVKGRPVLNPLIAHVATVERARAEGVFDADAERLAAAFWPGPLTLVLPRQPSGHVCDLACAGLASIGLRVPNQPIALALLHAFERPVAAPSANLSGRLSPTRIEHVYAELGATVDVAIDGGACAYGIESTIIACADSTATLLRPGSLSSEMVEAVLGHRLASSDLGTIQAPGMMASHYAPNTRMRLDATSLRQGEVGLDFNGRLEGALDLSPLGDLRQAAANLFSHLRLLDSLGAHTIAAAPVPHAGLGAAINDRLRRAAAPRDI